ncbi:unnamed protein product [Polarella glacialis]|uniref:PDZ domain-containing protein n=1 Tax=Polarella glacialis TaxID=89957 RepID=A0A813GVA8_POLGL|nr:unnamed protein product [Polarella glacialis]CAE8677993.1 unnamed protein product [Polarella glacialis]
MFLFSGCCLEETDTSGVVEKRVDDPATAEDLPDVAYKVQPVSVLSRTDMSETSSVIDQASSSTYIVTVTKGAGEGFGLEFDVTDAQMPVVARVKGGSLIDAWNHKCKESQVVSPMDCMTMVNGDISSSQEMVDRLKQTGTFDLTFTRPQEHTVIIDKAGKVLGLWLTITAGTGLLVAGVQDGVAKESGANVKAFDRITAVNGKEEEPPKLLELIKNLAVLELKVLSYSS